MQIPHTLSGDGQLLGLTEVSPNAMDVALLSLRDMTTSLQFQGMSPSLSHDGRWVAYTSNENESGRYQIYVRPTSGAAGRWQISTDGGVEPLWAANGSELFYRQGDKVLAVDVTTHGRFEFGTPRLLFEGPYRLNGLDSRDYDVTRDGQRFLMLKDETQPIPSQLNVVLNWHEDLKRAVTVGK